MAVLRIRFSPSRNELFFKRRFVGFAQGNNSRHDVTEIMREPHRERAEIFLPRHVQQAAFGNRLACDVQPDAFVTEQEPVAAEHRLAMLPEIRHPSRFDVADAKHAGHISRRAEAVAQASHQRLGIGLVDHVPEMF